MKILIVEDEKILADSLKALLESKGFEAEAVYDGETGKDFAELGIYDLLILDVMMPKMNGYEVARTVRKNAVQPLFLCLPQNPGLKTELKDLTPARIIILQNLSIQENFLPA